MRWLIGAAIGLAVFAIAVVIARHLPDLSHLASYGYAGVFVLMVVSGGSIFLPAPGFAAVMTAGVLWNPLIVGVVAGLGNATGEFTGYLAGRGGRALIAPRDSPLWRDAERWLQRFGFPALVVFSAIPNPFFDAVGIAAGSLGFSARHFWLACALGNTVKYTVIAVLGSYALVLLARG